MTFNQGGGNQFLRPLQELLIWKLSETAAAAFCSELFLFRRMVQNGIPRVCFYFCSTERTSELFCLLLKGSEGNSESLLLIVPRNIIPSCFLFHGRVRNGFREFSVQRNSRNSVGNNLLSHLFRQRGIIFLSEIPNPISNTELARLGNVYRMGLTLLFPVAILLLLCTFVICVCPPCHFVTW